MVRLIAALVIALVGIVSIVLLAVCRRRWKRLIVNGQTALGTIEGIGEKKYRMGVWQQICVGYTADGIRRKYKTMRYGCRFCLHQQLTVRYLKEKPRFCVIDRPRNYAAMPEILLILMAFLLYLYLIMLVGVLFSEDRFDVLHDAVWGAGLLISVLLLYFTERSLFIQKTMCSGRICWVVDTETQQVILAEYTVNGNLYETREMKIPRKRREKAYEIGEEIAVKYDPKHPYRSIIAEDVYSFRAAKLVLLLMLLYIVFMAVLYALEKLL